MIDSNIHILIVRTSSLIIDFKTYNCQETGLAAALVRKGFRVSFVTPGKQYKHIQFPIDNKGDINIYTVDFLKLNRNICWYKGYFKLLKMIRPDLIHINSISLSMSFLTQLWADKHGIKTVVIQGNYEVTQKTILKQLEQLFNYTIGRYIIKHCNGVGCKTYWASDFIKKYVPSIKTKLTRIGLDTSRFYNKKYIDWRKMLELNDEKILLYVGTLEKRRNPLFLIEILNNLSDDYHLIIVGNGILKEEIKTNIKYRKLEKRCHLLGKLSQEELPSLYKTADIFLLPSDYEIFGMVILESMYFGTPVISTHTAGAESIITSGKDGIILEKKDVSIWCNNIIRMMDDTDLLESMGNEAKKTIENYLTWDQTVHEFMNLYEKALKDETK